MLTDRKALDKLRRIHAQYSARRFETLATVEARFTQTTEHFRTTPGPESGLTWQPAPPGTRWGGSGLTGWFAGEVTLPRGAAGRRIWVRFHCGQEGMLFRDGQCWGVFDDNHPYVCLALEGEPGRSYQIAVEAYSGHDFPGCMPDDAPIRVDTDSRVFDGISVAAERADVSAFVFDLQVLGQLVEILGDNSLRKNQVARELARVFALVPQSPGETTEEVWRPALEEARAIMRPLLECANGDTAPTIGILGGSHMDTAWLWPIDETWRKVARTNSSMVNLMEQYPELIFIQSSPCHTAALLERYPDVFERMQPLVARVCDEAPALIAPVTVEAANVVVEAVKWAEEGNAYVVRLYDAGRQQTRTRVKLPRVVKAVRQANMLEEAQAELALDAEGGVVVDLHPFEIVTLRCELG